MCKTFLYPNVRISGRHEIRSMVSRPGSTGHWLMIIAFLLFAGDLCFLLYRYFAFLANPIGVCSANVMIVIGNRYEFSVGTKLKAKVQFNQNV